MDRSEIEARIRRMLVTRLGVEPDLVNSSSRTTPLLGRGIGLDSMEAMALVAAIEDGFDLVIADNDLTADLFKDLATIAGYVGRELARASGCQEAQE